MDVEIKVPSLGESESQATLVSWRKQRGEVVDEDEVLAEIESDKITMEIPAPDSGVLREVRKKEGEVVVPGEVIGMIEVGAAAPKPEKKTSRKKKEVARPQHPVGEKKETTRATPPVRAVSSREAETVKSAARTAGRIQERVPMSALRRTIARRLKEAQNTAAILTTFNEVDMKAIVELRRKYREAFKKKHGVDLGYMSFFVRACIEGLRRFPVLNAFVDGDDIVYRNFYDIGIAVSTPAGLVVPILRDAGALSQAEIERGIANLAQKAREGRLLPEDLKGGTFSITNGGVFGSMLSTPILNPPQSAILDRKSVV